MEVMSFTHDMIMVTDVSPSKDMMQSKPAITANGTIPSYNVVTPVQPIPNSYKDPLRELVLISESDSANQPDSQVLSNMTTLAKEASKLENIREVQPNEMKKAYESPAPLGRKAKPEKSNITTLFTDPRDYVDPNKEREFLEKLEALEETDSEAFDGMFYSYSKSRCIMYTTLA